jgi:hypothetical protein
VLFEHNQVTASHPAALLQHSGCPPAPRVPATSAGEAQSCGKVGKKYELGIHNIYTHHHHHQHKVFRHNIDRTIRESKRARRVRRKGYKQARCREGGERKGRGEGGGRGGVRGQRGNWRRGQEGKSRDDDNLCRDTKYPPTTTNDTTTYSTTTTTNTTLLPAPTSTAISQALE